MTTKAVNMVLLKCWTGIYFNAPSVQSLLHFPDKAQSCFISSLCAQSCEEVTQSYSLYDKKKACVSASMAARSHRNLPADALLDVKDVSSRYLSSHKTENFFSFFLIYKNYQK